MKNNIIKFLLINILVLFGFCLFAQNYYWVFYTDKIGVNFDPYEYFDSKAIERREKLALPLYDISDYPVNSNYSSLISAYCDEYIGESRWLNASAIYTDSQRIEFISKFDFVLKVQKIDNDFVLADIEEDEQSFETNFVNNKYHEQIERMQGEKFIEKGIDGKGLRIAVFDGGFPNVDTHPAFKHLRDNNQIVKTWNFPKKKENVYGWNSHGTSVLSCIAGIDNDGKNIGLASGAEFLLARTEVGPEPAKEEVWWAMALEWADKNGADIVNSSLGYGIDRHKLKDMDGNTSVVVKAANIALEKGIIVVNAAGNEGDDKSWQKIITPADSEAVLTVGGIESKGDFHINFSSYGPSYDGRIKPNVSAFGHAYAAKPNGYSYVYGTSFASPLVAGFVACAWQTKRNLNANEMKKEIEKSADKYPYFDYANGYGVPMASYFLKEEKAISKSFEIIENEKYVEIHLQDSKTNKNTIRPLFYHIRNSEGKIIFYEQLSISGNKDVIVDIQKSLFQNKNDILALWFENYTEEYSLKNFDENILDKDEEFTKRSTKQFTSKLTQEPGKEKYSKFGPQNLFYIQAFFSRGFVFGGISDNYDPSLAKAKDWSIGIRYKQAIIKPLAIGINLSYSKANIPLNDFSDFVNNNRIDLLSYKENFQIKYFTGEFYTRFRFVPAGILGIGLFMDCGIYASHIHSSKFGLKYKTPDSKVKQLEKYSINDNLQYGLVARLGYDMFSIYFKYALTELAIENKYILPSMQLGLEISLPIE